VIQAEKKQTSLRIAAVIAILFVIFAIPVIMGYQYHLLSLAYWNFGKQPFNISAKHVDGKMVTVKTGEFISCGFFALVKQS
jgi:hypothetical protein